MVEISGLNYQKGKNLYHYFQKSTVRLQDCILNIVPDIHPGFHYLFNIVIVWAFFLHSLTVYSRF